ncbi:6-hydroxymethylpterin diphosphokinase MptE-like protein [Brevibacillus sp. FSL K6-0770]|uniref:motility associated factor glycosyltransferase family protein n=1 Tax=unclassified Brevibacillus TaxID=2684853 RepID=UPI00156AF570|nr:6-hydroxymethylpterin diphosphokinase MptE-like protein [Brevibacillus sp. HD1.4A]NRQ53468.1 motility associated factor glycosyltransferase family protein [Brevibacillus sp. HD1.4A]
MVLIDNVNSLKKHYPEIWAKCRNPKLEIKDQVKLEPTQMQGWTVSILMESGWNYVHSKYNPEKEAERFIDSLEEIQDRHVLFYGAGFGYHIDAFIKKFPNTPFSIYEPNMAIFQQLIERKKIDEWIPVKRLKNLMVEENPDDCRKYLIELTNLLEDEIYLVILPSYKRIFSEQTQTFIKMFRDVVYAAHERIITGKVFAKRMAINGLFNLPAIVKTPNILAAHNGYFKGKPAIIVGAGPSLNDEFENLRYIKENGLAYIFAVGSSINQLLNAGIVPDAAFAYDGSAMNTKVFRKVLENEIDSVPLIFGSTMGFETVQNYPGKMSNFLVRDDYIIDLFLKDEDNRPFHYIDRFGSIATLTLQILDQLGFSPIIFTGQNLAYRGGQVYAQGVEYTGTDLGDKKKEYAVEVKDVHGNVTLSGRGHVEMREEMEALIQKIARTDIINTTKGGAHIEGTVFLPMEQLIAEQLTIPHVVKTDWLEVISQQDGYRYDLEYFKKVIRELLSSCDELGKIIRRFAELLEDMDRFIESQNNKQLEVCLTKFDKLFDRLQANKLNMRIVQPMNHMEFQLVLKMFDDIRPEPDPKTKSRRVVDQFGNYLSSCKSDSVLVKKILEDIHEKILGEPIVV